jgi:LacI family transcriptional regulator
MATIKEVAELAGVSVATVSRFMNNSGYVGKASREKVEKAIKLLDFSPNEVARSLYQKKSKLIGLLLPDIANPFFPLVAKGVEDKIKESGYSLILGNVQGDLEKEKEYLKIFAQIMWRESFPQYKGAQKNSMV